MARVFIDGFESGSLDLWDNIVSSVSINSSTGLNLDGDYALYCDTGRVDKDFTANDEMYFAFRYRSHTTDARGVMCLYMGTNLMLDFRKDNSDEPIKVYRGSTLIATGIKTLVLDTTYRIEIYIKIADSGGRAVIKIDDVIDIDFTGDTKEGTDTQVDEVRLGYGSVVYGQAYYDNFIMDDAAWIGDTNIQAVVPTGAGNSTGWTPSVGANFECVDEIPYSDADYVSTNVVDTTDTYAAGNMVGTVGNVKCVQVQARLVKDGAPTPTNAKLVVRSGATDYLSADNAVPTVAKSFSNIWENNPADAAAWEEADVNAMEIGVKSAA